MFDETPMTRRQAAVATAAGALAVAAMSSAAEAKAQGPHTSALKALLAAHNTAFTNHDLKGVLATMTPHAVLMGTGPGELWVGTAELANAYQHFFKDFEKGAQKFQELWYDEKLGGDLASLMVVFKVTMTQGGKSNDVGINMSVLAEKRGNGWMIRNLHFSNLSGRS